VIVGLKKVVFIGVKRELGDFLVRSQEEGFIEFIRPKGKGALPLPPELQKLITAIKILRKQPLKAPYRGGAGLHYADEVADQVLHLKAALEKHEEEKRFLEIEIARVAPFGAFSFEDIAFIEKNTGRKIQFFCVKTSKRELIGEHPSLIYVGTEYDLDYFISINRSARSYPGMIEMHFTRSVNELKSHLSFVEETLQQIAAELKGFAGHIDFLKERLLDRFDIHELISAKKSVSFPIEGSLFSIEAWVPENRLDQIGPLIGDSAISCSTIALEPTDRIPTCMENRGFPRLGQDLVVQYDIPAASDKDPSGWVFWAFALFFAMIVADGGYGLVYLLLALFMHKKLSHLKGGYKRFVKLGLSLATCCILWGIFTSSFFGLSFTPQGEIWRYSPLLRLTEKKADYHLAKKDQVYQSWVQQFPAIRSATSGREMLEKGVKERPEGGVTYDIIDEFSDNILLEISLLVGVLHICCGLFRYANRRLANLGWIGFTIGGYLYCPTALDATSIVYFMGLLTPELAGAIGLQLVYIGIGVAVVFALLQKGWRGIDEGLQSIQVFSDVLSYLRLYALALAGTIMARTFNEIGGEIHLVFGALVVIFGHSVNLLLCTMSGVIHGLRLNFIEWYHYCFEGDGKLFRPLVRLRKIKFSEE
jgi:V/A-type H+-transporting ATPase subunit I